LIAIGLIERVEQLEMSTKSEPSFLSKAQPFFLGGLSGMTATCCIQPIDLIKTRIQAAGDTPGAPKTLVSVARHVIKNEGFLAFYNGLNAGLLRQATYTTARMGIFKSIIGHLEKDGKKSTLFEKSAAGFVAGGLGSVFGTPADVALIRIQTDALLPKEQRRGYTGSMNALVRIFSEEGLRGFFTGCVPVVVRASALNLGMLAGHDQVLEMVKQQTNNFVIQTVIAKSVSGFLASAFSLPFDFIKTRIQKQKRGPDGTLPYSSSIDCFRKVLVKEGPMAFYTGFWTYYIRIAPHVMITLFVFDALDGFLKKAKL